MAKDAFCKEELGTLTKVELRDIWEHEALNFTNWLAQESSIELLGRSVGKNLKVRETESPVGRFNADILATDRDTDSCVIIENQLEKSDHDHLGKIVTYAAGKDAHTVIWVMKGAFDEHREAIRWLNEHTDNEIDFFLVQIEVWRIGDSKPAPHFTVIESPNGWLRAERLKKRLGPDEKHCVEYWQIFANRSHKTPLFESGAMWVDPPKPETWRDIWVGADGYNFCATISWRRKRVGIKICIPKDEELAARLLKQLPTFEKLLQLKGKSRKPIGFRRTIEFQLTGCDFDERENWRGYIDWQIESVVKLRNKLLELGF